MVKGRGSLGVRGCTRQPEPSLPMLTLATAATSWGFLGLPGAGRQLSSSFPDPIGCSPCGLGKTTALSGPLQTRCPKSHSKESNRSLLRGALPSYGQRGGQGPELSPGPSWHSFTPPPGLIDPQPLPDLLLPSLDTRHQLSSVQGRTELVIKA